MGDNNSNESLKNKYIELIALKDDENRLERITKLLEILSIEMGTIASVKASAFTDEINPHLEAFKIKMAELKPQLEELKPRFEAFKLNMAAQKKNAKTAANTALTTVSAYGTGVVNGVVSFFGQNPPVAKGGKRIAAHAASAYKSTGDKVLLLIDNKKLHRSIYVKGNGKAKYCKINNEFILLSKLKNKIINI